MSQHLLPAEKKWLLAGGLSGPGLRRVIRHLTSCQECRWQVSQVAIPESTEEDLETVGPSSSDPGEDSLIELLLTESFALRYRDPDRMVELAELARLRVERLDDQLCGSLFLADFKARVWAELGNAYRVGDYLPASEEALEQAVAWAKRGSRELKLATRIADVTASLFSDQGRFAEACELLADLQDVYLAQGEEHLVGRSRISEGTFAGHDGRPEEGIALICDGLLRIDLERDPKLKVIGLHALVFNLIEAGRYRKARTLLWHIRPLFEQDADHLNILRLRWLEGKICSGLGDTKTAEEHFQLVRKKFKKHRQHYDSALVSLDLAMLWAKQGRREETRQLAQELIASFRALRIGREAVASLLVYCQWTSHAYIPDDVLYDRLKMTSTLVEQLERQKPRKP